MKRLGKLPQKGRLFVAYKYKNPEVLLSYMGSHVDQNLDKLLALMGKNRKDFFNDFSNHKVIGGWADYKGNFYDNPKDADNARFRTLNENPDGLLILPNNKNVHNKKAIILNYYDNDSYAFGYFSYDLFDKYMKNNDFYEKFSYKEHHEVPKNNTFFIEKNELHSNLFPTTKGWLDRDMFKICGRLWHKSRVISFWDRVSKQDIKKLIQDIYKKTAIKISNDWVIEYGDEDFKRIGDYLGVEKYKPMNKNIQHILSPMLKNNDIDKSNSGAEKYKNLAKKMGYSSVAQMNHYYKHNLHENNTIEVEVVPKNRIYKYTEKGWYNFNLNMVDHYKDLKTATIKFKKAIKKYPELKFKLIKIPKENGFSEIYMIFYKK